MACVAGSETPAFAQCAVTVGGSVSCTTNTTTTNTTNTDGANPSSSDQIQLWDNGTAINANTFGGILVNGYGLALVETGGTQASITTSNPTGNTIESNNGNPALTLSGNGGNISYTGDGSIIGDSGPGISASNIGIGKITITTAGTISAGDSTSAGQDGIDTTAIAGSTTINLTGGTIQGNSTNGLEGSIGISSTSQSGDITITANDIAPADFALTGINASITGSGAGIINITTLGTINTIADGIDASNNNTGGVTIGADAGSILNAGGTGQFVRVIGTGGAIQITNAAGSQINAATGVDAQVVNTNDSGNVTIDQEGAITATSTGIIAATSGTGSILVEGAGDVVGGSGAAQGAVTYGAPATASNVGIFANQSGASGGITIEGTGTTSGNDAILAVIDSGGNASNITINRSGNVTVTGTDGWGIAAETYGTGGVTVENTGTIAAAAGSTAFTGILAEANGGNVDITNVGAITVNSTDLYSYGIYASTGGTGTITVNGTSGVTSTGDAIDAITTGTGNVSVTDTGALVADSGDTGSGFGIDASSQGGGITVTPGSTVSGAVGINATTIDSGTVTVTADYGVTAHNGDAINASTQDGDINVTADATVTSTSGGDGVDALTTGLGTITVTGSGNISGAVDGISAFETGAGPGSGNGILISGSGNTGATSGDGITAQITDASNNSNILINRTGTVTVAAAGGDGIQAITVGLGNVTVSGVGNVTAGTGAPAIGIDAEAAGGNVSVTPAGFVTGGNGINATTTGPGTVTVTTVVGAAGNVTGSDGYGVNTSAEDGDTVVTNNAAAISGTTWAVDSTSTGIGTITIQGPGDFVGGSSGGINALASGAGPGAGNTAILITGTGDVSATTGVGIQAEITDASNAGNILINLTGTVTVEAAGGDGVHAITDGTGDVTVTGIGNVAAGTGASATGIDAEGAGGNVLVTPAGFVSGGNGILGVTTGAGTVTVTTAAGAAGNVTGDDGFGVETYAQDGATVITNDAAEISGTTWAVAATSTGLGTITIQGTGNDVGGSLGGVGAVASGAGPGAGNTAILVTGTGNTSATTGVGISALITDAANDGNILINATGTVTVGSSGRDGIDAVTVGPGNVTVSGVGNVTAGTGATTYGILATSQGGNITVTPAGTVTAGGTGIWASTIGAGTITITTATGAGGDVTGTARDGIDTTAVNGATIVTNNSDPVTGGVNGDYSWSSGTGTVTVTGPGTYAGGTGYGIAAVETGAGPGAGVDGIVVSGTGNTSSVSGTGILAAITDTSNTSNVDVTRSGTVTVGTNGDNGIDAIADGSGNVTVSGVGNVTAGTGTTTIGILADAAGGNVLVTPAGTVTAGGTGISASTNGSGTIIVTTAAGDAGDVTGAAGDGIDTSAVNGNTTVTNNATAVTGAINGAYAWSSGTGIVTVTGAGTYAGGTGDGIVAAETGAGPGAGVNGVVVSGSGNTTTNTGTGILAEITLPSNKSNISVTRSGTVTVGAGGGDGVDAITVGIGSVTVSGVGNVTAGTGSSTIGIEADSTGGNVVVSPAGSVTAGGTGISATTTLAGTIGVTTASGAAGDVAGTAGDGIDTSAADGATLVTNDAAIVSGGVNGVDSTSSGLGAITITGPGAFAGGTGFGIEATENGAGPGAGIDGIAISGTGNVSTVTGTGIGAFITNAFNASKIDITDTGSVSVGTGGADGIDAISAGTGNIIVNGIGNVTAGTGSTTTGILGSAQGGTITITPTGAVIGGGNGISASTNQSGAIAVTTASNVTGSAANGILTVAVDGTTTIAVQGGTVSGNGTGNAGVNASASGAGNIGVTVAVGATVTGGATAGGIAVTQSGTGSNDIDNAGTVLGAGSVANPVIAIAATSSGATTITNEATGVIESTDATVNNRPANVAVYSTVATGNTLISNAGLLVGEISLSNATNTVENAATGIWDVRDNATTGVVAASFGSGGANTLSNGGTINAGNALAPATSTFTGIETIDNSGTINAGLYGPGDVTTFAASPPSSAVQTVDNNGTMNVHGTLNFEGDSTFNNAGGLINMATAGHVTTDVTALNMSVGTGTSSNTYAPGTAYNFVGGTNSQLALDTDVGLASSTGASVPSDRLLISGTATATTGITINDTNIGTGAFNPVGITLVAVNGASSNAFFLDGVTQAGSNDALEPNRGPMGAIKKGFWFYPLLQTTHAQAAADGLSGPDSTEYRLFGLPDAEAYQLPLAITGAQNIWYQTVLGWSEHLEDVRESWNNDLLGNNAGDVSSVWLKVTGSWGDRTDSHDLSALVPAASVLPAIDTSFSQNVYSVQLGGDMETKHIFASDDVLVLSGSIGYVGSELDFKSSPNSFNYTGAILGGSAVYLNGHFFADVLGKVDLLTADLKLNSLAPFGYTGQDINANTWGVMSDLGYHFDLNHNAKAPPLENWYIEPLVTLAYTQSSLGNFSALGTTTDFSDGETFRGALGASLGGPITRRGDRALNFSVTGKYWEEFTNDTQADLETLGPALPLMDVREKGFGEIIGTIDFTDFGGGWTAFVNGGEKFNNQFTMAEFKAGIRYAW